MSEYEVTIRGSCVKWRKKPSATMHNGRQCRFDAQGSGVNAATSKPATYGSPPKYANQSVRKNKFIKLINALDFGEAFFLTLLTDKHMHPQLVKDVKTWKSWLNKFRSRFMYQFKRGFLVWKV